MTKFILLRHGQTDWNVQHLYQGQSDISLNETGIQQANSAAAYLRNELIDVAFSSDLSRAVTTAKTVLKYHPNTKLIIDPIFRERAFGSYEGMPYQRDLLNPTIGEQIAADPYGFKFSNGGESLREVHERAKTTYERIIHLYPDKTVLIVSHGTFLSLFIVALKGLSISERKDIVIANASPIFIGENGELDKSFYPQ